MNFPDCLLCGLEHRGAHLDGTISVLALSTRREWKPRPELPRRYSGRGSWWSELLCSGQDIFSVKNKWHIYSTEAKKRERLGILYLKVSNVIDTLRLSGLKIREKMEQSPEIDARRMWCNQIKNSLQSWLYALLLWLKHRRLYTDLLIHPEVHIRS